MELRPAREGDLPALVALYNHYIATSPATFDIEPYTVEQRRPWFEQFRATGPHRLFVAVEGERLLGYAGSMSHRPKAAYATIYVTHERHGGGVATALYTHLLEALRGQDLHRALAGITLPNPGSVRLHEKLGFRAVGTFSEQGRKFGRYWDVCWMEKPL